MTDEPSLFDWAEHQLPENVIDAVPWLIARIRAEKVRNRPKQAGVAKVLSLPQRGAA